MWSSILQEIITLFTSALTQYGSGIGAGVNGMITSLFIDSSGNTPVLSTTGGVLAIFAAIGLTVSISVLIWKFITSWGNRS